MVDIPEHLLQRSREARARATGSPAEEGAAPEPAAEAEEPPPAAAEPPEAAEQEVAVPDESGGGELAPVTTEVPVAVEAAEPAKVYAPASQPTGTAHGYRGARVPGWLIPVYVLVPLLMIALGMTMVNAIEEEKGAEPAGPNGAEIYTKNCAACHGPDGGGGVGPALDKLEAVFPDFQAQYEWVAKVASQTDGPYGDGGTGNNGEGATAGAMPAFDGTLSQQEIYAVVAHEREKFSSADPSTFPPAAEYGGPTTETTAAAAGSE